MARGFESKSVESQQTEGYSEKKRRLSAEEAERAGRRESLELSRARVVRELEGATSELRKTALRNALEFLDGELKKL